MRRKLFSALLIVVLCLSMAVSVCAAGADCVYDDADLLSQREEFDLQEKLSRIGDAYDVQIVVVTLESSNNRYIDYLVDDVYDQMNFGVGPNHDGVMLLMCMDIREYQIIGNGYASKAIDDDKIEKICDAIGSDLSDGDYAAAFDEFADQCEYYLDGYRNGFPFRFGRNLLIALGVGIVVGLIVVFVLKSQLKSVHSQRRAHDYVKSGSMNIRTSKDIFLYRSLTRTKIERSSSSGSSRSSGGSSRSRGGGSF